MALTVDTNSIEILLGQREQAFGIHKLLHNLPEPYKEVFSLRVLGELSYQDIAKLFGKTESWARVTFHRAKSVCYFADNRATDGTFEGTEVHSANGDIGIITERDRNGNITGLKQMEIPELTDFLEKSWKEK